MSLDTLWLFASALLSSMLPAAGTGVQPSAPKGPSTSTARLAAGARCLPRTSAHLLEQAHRPALASEGAAAQLRQLISCEDCGSTRALPALGRPNVKGSGWRRVFAHVRRTS